MVYRHKNWLYKLKNNYKQLQCIIDYMLIIDRMNQLIILNKKRKSLFKYLIVSVSTKL